MNTDSTHESQMARYEAVDAAPEHKQHTIFAHRVDTWKDIETGGYIAMVPERLTYAKTEEGALKAATSMILCMSVFVAAAVAPVSAEPAPQLAGTETCPTCGHTKMTGTGDYSCATCGMGRTEPCEHWLALFES